MNIEFIKASLKDIDQLIHVQNLSFYDDYIKYGECPAYNESKEQMANSIKNRIVYVIKDDERIIGDIIIKKLDDSRFYLRVLCVIPEYHNKSIGRKAIEFMEKHHPEALSWELITPAGSLRNHYFYEKVGYEKIREIKHSDILTMYEYKKVIASLPLNC